jgi:hypothetical protein
VETLLEKGPFIKQLCKELILKPLSPSDKGTRTKSKMAFPNRMFECKVSRIDMNRGFFIDDSENEIECKFSEESMAFINNEIHNKKNNSITSLVGNMIHITSPIIKVCCKQS